MSHQFKDLMCGLDDETGGMKFVNGEWQDHCHRYVDTKEDVSRPWEPEEIIPVFTEDVRWYQRGFNAGKKEGLKLLHEHMDICTKPLVIQEKPLNPNYEYRCLCPCEDEGGCLACDRGNHDLHLVPKEKQ